MVDWMTDRHIKISDGYTGTELKCNFNINQAMKNQGQLSYTSLEHKFRIQAIKKEKS